MVRLVLNIVPSFFLAGALLAQVPETKRKPVLIRPDQTETVEAEGPVRPDPGLAREHVKVGDFYFKRDNFKAAAARYREAIKYDAKWSESYQKLIRALEKMKDFEAAVEICDLFQRANPDSKEITDFRELQKRMSSRLSASNQP